MGPHRRNRLHFLEAAGSFYSSRTFNPFNFPFANPVCCWGLTVRKCQLSDNLFTVWFVIECAMCLENMIKPQNICTVFHHHFRSVLFHFTCISYPLVVYLWDYRDSANTNGLRRRLCCCRGALYSSIASNNHFFHIFSYFSLSRKWKFHIFFS